MRWYSTEGYSKHWMLKNQSLRTVITFLSSLSASLSSSFLQVVNFRQVMEVGEITGTGHQAELRCEAHFLVITNRSCPRFLVLKSRPWYIWEDGAIDGGILLPSTREYPHHVYARQYGSAGRPLNTILSHRLRVRFSCSILMDFWYFIHYRKVMLGKLSYRR